MGTTWHHKRIQLMVIKPPAINVLHCWGMLQVTLRKKPLRGKFMVMKYCFMAPLETLNVPSDSRRFFRKAHSGTSCRLQFLIQWQLSGFTMSILYCFRNNTALSWLFQLNQNRMRIRCQDIHLKKNKKKETKLRGMELLLRCWRAYRRSKLFTGTKEMLKLFAVVDWSKLKKLYLKYPVECKD